MAATYIGPLNEEATITRNWVYRNAQYFAVSAYQMKYRIHDETGVSQYVDRLPVLLQNKALPQIKAGATPLASLPNSKADLRLKHVRAYLETPANIAIIYTFDDDPSNDPFADMNNYKWSFRSEMISRQTYVDKEGNPLLVCSPVPIDRSKNGLLGFKPVSVPQSIPQIVGTKTIRAKQSELGRWVQFQGKVNSKRYLSDTDHAGCWLCQRVECKIYTANGMSFTVGSDDNQLYDVTFIIRSAGPFAMTTRILGQNPARKVPNDKPQKTPWNGLCYSVDPVTGALPYLSTGQLQTIYNDGENSDVHAGGQEVIVELYDEIDFSALDIGQGAANKKIGFDI